MSVVHSHTMTVKIVLNQSINVHNILPMGRIFAGIISETTKYGKVKTPQLIMKM